MICVQKACMRRSGKAGAALAGAGASVGREYRLPSRAAPLRRADQLAPLPSVVLLKHVRRSS